jgi:hypothetical protein
MFLLALRQRFMLGHVVFLLRSMGCEIPLLDPIFLADVKKILNLRSIQVYTQLNSKLSWALL